MEAGAEDGALTRAAGRALTPDYASPEQIRGAAVSTSSDMYSLGVVLYELLTGCRPFSAKPGADQDPIELVALRDEPKRPSEAAASVAQRRRLRGDLDTIVLKALKKDPRERYGAILQLADDIELHLRGDPVRARPNSRWYRTGKFVTRNRLPVGVAAFAFLVVTATAVLALREAHLAGQQRDRAAALSARAEAASDFQSMLITEAAQSGKPVTVLDMLARSEALEMYRLPRFIGSRTVPTFLARRSMRWSAWRAVSCPTTHRGSYRDGWST